MHWKSPFSKLLISFKDPKPARYTLSSWPASPGWWPMSRSCIGRVFSWELSPTGISFLLRLARRNMFYSEHSIFITWGLSGACCRDKGSPEDKTSIKEDLWTTDFAAVLFWFNQIAVGFGSLLGSALWSDLICSRLSIWAVSSWPLEIFAAQKTEWLTPLFWEGPITDSYREHQKTSPSFFQSWPEQQIPSKWRSSWWFFTNPFEKDARQIGKKSSPICGMDILKPPRRDHLSHPFSKVTGNPFLKGHNRKNRQPEVRKGPKSKA